MDKLYILTIINLTCNSQMRCPGIMMNPATKITLAFLLLVTLSAPPENGACKERQQQIVVLWWNVMPPYTIV